jgi:hypothetical protein
MDGDTRVCPFCGKPPGAGVFCEACGRNLGGVEQLPTAIEFAAESGPDLETFLSAMHAAGDPGTVTYPSSKPRAFRRTPSVTGWVVIPVDREDFEKPRRYEPGLFLSVSGTFHRLDSELRGWGQRNFPRYEHSVSAEPVEPGASLEPRILAALASLVAAA